MFQAFLDGEFFQQTMVVLFFVGFPLFMFIWAIIEKREEKRKKEV